MCRVGSTMSVAVGSIRLPQSGLRGPLGLDDIHCGSQVFPYTLQPAGCRPATNYQLLTTSYQLLHLALFRPLSSEPDPFLYNPARLGQYKNALNLVCGHFLSSLFSLIFCVCSLLSSTTNDSLLVFGCDLASARSCLFILLSFSSPDSLMTIVPQRPRQSLSIPTC